MEINVQKLKWNLYQVQLYQEDGKPIFSETAELLSEKKRKALYINLRRRFPELAEKDIETRLLERMEAADAAHAARGGQGEAQADRLVRLAQGPGNLFFHDDLGDAYAQVFRDGHYEVKCCHSREFKRWLVHLFKTEEGKNPYREAVATALDSLESQAWEAGPQYSLSNRVAAHKQDNQDIFYYSLANEAWQAVKVTAGGWEIVNSTPVPLFRRYGHQKAQVLPIPGGDPFQILSFVNVQDEMARLLLMVYTITCLVPEIPHPIPIVHGPGGAAKTTFSHILRMLIDPSLIPALTFPWEERELVQKLSHHWFAAFDNVSTLPDWTQDTLCRACTGEGFSKRELYSDDEDIIYSFRRCVLLNGINIAATHADLLRRAILLPLEEIPPEKRQPERKLLAEFEKARPHILGGMFDVLSRAMALHPTIHLRELPSMADFAEWGAAVSEALGKSQEAFLQAYNANIQSQHTAAIESSLVASVLMSFMEDKEKWEGSPSQLYAELQAEAEALHVSVKDKQWPKNPGWLIRGLNRVITNLRASGISLKQDPGRNQKGRSLTILRQAQDTVLRQDALLQQPLRESPVQAEQIGAGKAAVVNPHSQEPGNAVPDVPDVPSDRDSQVARLDDIRDDIGDSIRDDIDKDGLLSEMPASQIQQDGKDGRDGISCPLTKTVGDAPTGRPESEAGEWEITL